MKQEKIDLLDTFIVEPASGNPPKNIVVLFHGYGADGRDLIGIGAQWQNDLPDTVFVSPHAPFQCEMSPMGRQWFSLAEYTIPAMERGIIKTWPILKDYLDALLKRYGLTADKMVMGGFSQGCMMSLYALPRLSSPCAGILGYSGRLLDENGLTANTETPVHLIHGEADTVVPFESFAHAWKIYNQGVTR